METIQERHRMEVTDRTLLEQIHKGSESAFATFAARYVPLIRGYLRRFVPASKLDDVLQDILVGIFRGAGDFNGGDSARAWILGISRRCGARAMRLHVGEPAQTLPLPEVGIAAGWGASPEDHASWNERLKHIEDALESMSPLAAEVIILRDIEGLTAPEAAAVLDISVQALKSRLHRARLELMEILHKKDIHGS